MIFAHMVRHLAAKNHPRQQGAAGIRPDCYPHAIEKADPPDPPSPCFIRLSPDQALPEAEVRSTLTPGPMVEDRETFLR